MRGALANSLARAGRRTEAQRVIDGMILDSRKTSLSQSDVAMGYVGLGDVEKAFEGLDKSFESNDEGILLLKTHPMFSPLRDDPRYKELLKRVNLAE